MARDKTDKTDGTPAATLATIATREPSEAQKQAWRESFEIAAARKAKEYLAHFENLKLVDGGVALFSIGISFVDDNGIRYPRITDEQLRELLHRAQTDYQAYLGTLYVARLWMARRIPLPAPLLTFVLAALSGKVVKPKGGRKRAADTLLRSFMYAWALFIHQQAPSIPLVRNEHKTRGWPDWSACDLVARAFSSAGKHTTFNQVKSYCYDESYWHVRASASMAWQKGRRYEDTGREFDFDLDAFCFGKP